MSTTQALATQTLSVVLRSLTDAELVATIRARELVIHGSGSNAIRDYFDLAEAFLHPDAIQQTLTRLDRTTLTVLSAIASGASSAADVAARVTSDGGEPLPESTVLEVAERARALLLLAPDSLSLYEPVRAQLAAWPSFGLPSLEQLVTAAAPAALEPVPDVDQRIIDRLAAERAFTATAAVTELLAEIEREPARELAKGGVSLPDTKRLASGMSVDLESVATFVDVAERAELLARESGYTMITELGRSWLLLPTGARWGALAGAWHERLPADIRRLLGERTHALWGQGLRGYIDWLYPAGGDWMDQRIASGTRDAELLGITANQAPSTPGALLLSEGAPEAIAAMGALLPPEVSQVYLQHDLSVVAPGPLTPEVDARLRGIADVESRALASTYRVSTSSVNRAMAAGESEQSMLDFLRSISLTGIPQPLAYLLHEAATRYGQVRVGALDSPDARSYVSSDSSSGGDEHLLGTIAVDQNLSALGFWRSEGRLLSRFTFDVVFWSLSDARYPVAAEDSSGAIIALRRQRTARPVSTDTTDPLDALIERLRIGGAAEPQEEGQAWLLRQLDIAIKSKVELTVTVRMPDDSEVSYVLEPTSVSSGRVRFRDRKSAIERTLPLSSIASLGPAT
ncbi:helicase-associated domain-containing protein [Lacisediminihabitans changchengi]|uniref:Helicase-associated domain-containing protein n=1 Tax=Lacisediminihabitans changchengi TaxID=2787634 RepID=A0A934SKA7_9MICO|nr:helicase-associated domain-containing protein [Lacisediminihabitans changchengi]MBK4348201.1 helicase-associated domain-containing protein [Lacisediminihabitans changchengi]